MHITAIKTPKITTGTPDIFQVLQAALPTVEEGDIIVVTSKIISICEGRVVPFADTDKESLLIQEADQYLPASLSAYGLRFTITDHTLIPTAGIDESNGDEHYILWPKNAQQSANDIRAFLSRQYGLHQVGVIITDSTCQPMRRGTYGIAIAHSGFAALRNYIGQPDLFGRPFGVTQANVSGGLAAAAVVAMGEGTEQTPIARISDVSFVAFQDRDPSASELAELSISLEEDLFAPFLTQVPWQKGQGGNHE